MDFSNEIFGRMWMNKLLEYYQRRILTAQDASQILRTRFVKYTELYIQFYDKRGLSRWLPYVAYLTIAVNLKQSIFME